MVSSRFHLHHQAQLKLVVFSNRSVCRIISEKKKYTHNTHTLSQMSHFQVLGVLNDKAAACIFSGVKGCRALPQQSQPSTTLHLHSLSLCYPWQPQRDTVLPATPAPPANPRVHMHEVCVCARWELMIASDYLNVCVYRCVCVCFSYVPGISRVK